jgi:hypothetical protein
LNRRGIANNPAIFNHSNFAVVHVIGVLPRSRRRLCNVKTTKAPAVGRSKKEWMMIPADGRGRRVRVKAGTYRAPVVRRTQQACRGGKGNATMEATPWQKRVSFSYQRSVIVFWVIPKEMVENARHEIVF